MAGTEIEPRGEGGWGDVTGPLLKPGARSPLEALAGKHPGQSLCSEDRRSELHGRADEEFPAKRIIDAGIGVAVTESARTGDVGVDDRRVAVEDIVDALPQ